jgi:uncharacterized protein (DUF4415 family)
MKAKTSSPKSQTDWTRVNALRDADIIIDDDSPEMTPEMWAGGVWRRGGVPFKPGKTLVSLRIDTEVLEWFRAQGPGYQSHMNALLRAYHDARRVEAEAAKLQRTASIPRRTRAKTATKAESQSAAPTPACGTIRKRPKPKR